MSEDKKADKEKAFRIEHDRPNCIGCGACVAVAPDFWELDDDGKANILKAKKKPDETQEREISDKEFKENMEAAESCPVNVIHLRRLKDDEKLI